MCKHMQENGFLQQAWSRTLLFPKHSWKHCFALLLNGWRAEAGLLFVLAKSSRLTGNKIFPGYCLIVLIWGIFLLPKQVWWPGPGSLCARPLSALLLLINWTERPGRQPGCSSGMEKSKTLFWPADSMYWLFVDEFFRCHPWQEKICPCN